MLPISIEPCCGSIRRYEVVPIALPVEASMMAMCNWSVDAAAVAHHCSYSSRVAYGPTNM
jgi:hypothetical protein